MPCLVCPTRKPPLKISCKTNCCSCVKTVPLRDLLRRLPAISPRASCNAASVLANLATDRFVAPLPCLLLSLSELGTEEAFQGESVYFVATERLPTLALVKQALSDCRLSKPPPTVGRRWWVLYGPNLLFGQSSGTFLHSDIVPLAELMKICTASCLAGKSNL